MSEAKDAACARDDEHYLRMLPTVDVRAIDISPNPAALTDELNLEVDFRLDKPVTNGVWDIQVEAKDYSTGDSHFQFSVADINVDGIQPSQLTNCGLLIASFKHDVGDIMDIKMVVQVSHQCDGLQRIVYNPLE